MEGRIREINIMKMDVEIITETKKKGPGIEALGNSYSFSAGWRNMKGPKEEYNFW